MGCRSAAGVSESSDINSL